MNIDASARLPPPEKPAPLRFDEFFDLPSGEMSRYVLSSMQRTGR
jgi:hypothetical protein